MGWDFYFYFKHNKYTHTPKISAVLFLLPSLSLRQKSSILSAVAGVGHRKAGKLRRHHSPLSISSPLPSPPLPCSISWLACRSCDRWDPARNHHCRPSLPPLSHFPHHQTTLVILFYHHHCYPTIMAKFDWIYILFGVAPMRSVKATLLSLFPCLVMLLCYLYESVRN